jgi:hypothetical protein
LRQIKAQSSNLAYHFTIMEGGTARRIGLGNEGVLIMSRKLILAAIALFALVAFALPTASFAQGTGWSSDPATSYNGDFQLQGR